jgi:hypothetical protein
MEGEEEEEAHLPDVVGLDDGGAREVTTTARAASCDDASVSRPLGAGRAAP